MPGPGRLRDPTLQHPRCVYQILKRHFARYTPEMVERTAASRAPTFSSCASWWTQASGRERTAAVVYAVGWTQHTVGAQYIRTASIIQLLLGNIGRPGGGIMAMRGHASIQGSTDIPTLFNLLPGYLPMPHATSGQGPSHVAWTAFAATSRRVSGTNADDYMVSLLKEYWGDAATPENDFCFDYLPRINGDHGTYQTVHGHDRRQGASATSCWARTRRSAPLTDGCSGSGMANLDWLVVRDLAMIESATFWKDSPEVATGEIVAEQCRTEVFFFPAAAHTEKEGTFTQTQRMLQWREKAVDPRGDQRSELWFFYHLGRLVKQRLAGSTDERDRALQDLAWDYQVGRATSPGGRRAAPDQRL